SMDAWFWIAGSALIVVTALGWLFVRSDAGRILVAIRENEQRCKYFGLPTSRIKTALIAGSAVVAALAGYAYAAYTDVVAPELGGFQFGTELVIWVALGGRGTLVGPAIAAVLIDFVSAYLGGTLPFVWQLLVGVVFTVVIVALPEGLGPAIFYASRRLLRRHGSSATRWAARILPATERPAPASDSVAIALQGVACRYGSLSVLKEISFVGRAGELIGLVGPNGAGKTTLIRCISDGKERSDGRVSLQGSGIGRLPPEYCARLGLGRKFQAPNIFETLSVSESFRIARARLERPSFWRRDDAVRLPEAALQVVRATGLADQLSITGRHLSHGRKQ
ncbi:MAG: ABC transporter permease subunit, partial [Gemmataceae bacterium]